MIKLNWRKWNWKFYFKVKNQVNGCNITVPFKKAVIPFLDKLSSEAEQTQSVNTISLHNGKLIGHNTDIRGFQKAINNLNYDVKDKKILILGAGGVVPSIIFALNKMEVSKITVSNRTFKKAENLKTQFNKIDSKLGRLTRFWYHNKCNQLRFK